MTIPRQDAPCRADRLDTLRQQYMLQIIDSAARNGRPVRVTPYVLAQPGPERHADLEFIEQHAARVGWQVTASTFADLGQSPPLAQRPGFGAACRYAAQGYAHGILAIARPAITTDNDSYSRVLEHLRERGVFLAYLPALREPTS